MDLLRLPFAFFPFTSVLVQSSKTAYVTQTLMSVTYRYRIRENNNLFICFVVPVWFDVTRKNKWKQIPSRVYSGFPSTCRDSCQNVQKLSVRILLQSRIRHTQSTFDQKLYYHYFYMYLLLQQIIFLIPISMERKIGVVNHPWSLTVRRDKKIFSAWTTLVYISQIGFKIKVANS